MDDLLDLQSSQIADERVEARRKSQQSKSSRFSVDSAKAPSKSFAESLSLRRSKSSRQLDVSTSECGRPQPLNDMCIFERIDSSIDDLEKRLISKMEEISTHLEGLLVSISSHSVNISQVECCEDALTAGAGQAVHRTGVPPMLRFQQLASIGGADLPLDDPIGQLPTPHAGRPFSPLQSRAPTLLETAGGLTHFAHECARSSTDATYDAASPVSERNVNQAGENVTVTIKAKPERGHLRKNASAMMSSSSVGTLNSRNSSSASSRRSSGVSSLHLWMAQGPKELQRLRSRHFLTELLWKFFSDSESSRLAHLYAVSMPSLIVASTIFATIHFTSPQNLKSASIIQDIAFDSFFSFDILARFLVCPSKEAFALSPYNYIDIIAGPLILCVRVITLCFLPELNDCLVGIVPVLRLLKVLRQFETFRLLLSAFKIAFEALPVLLFTLGIIVLVFSALIYLV